MAPGDEERVHPTVQTVNQVLERLGIHGLTLVLWTVVVACAVLRGDAAALGIVWADLKWIWLVLAGLALVVFIVTSLAAFFERRKSGRMIVRATPPSDAP